MIGKYTLLAALFFVLVLPVMLYADPAADAAEMIAKRKFDQAIEFLTKEIRDDPGYAELHFLLGKVYYIRGKYDLAKEQLLDCLERKRKHEEANYYLARVYVKQERWQEAKKILDEWIERSRDNKALFYNALGLYHLAREEFNDADLQFRLALVEDPGNLEYQRNMADLSFEQGIYAVAVQGYQKVLEQDSTDVDAYFKLGKSYYYQRMFSEALSALGNAIGLDSSYIEAYKVSGDIFMLAALSSRNGGSNGESQERFTSAVWMYRKYLDLGGEESAEIDYRLGQALFFLNVYEEAIARLQQAVALGVDKSAAYNLLAKAFFRLRQYDQAFDAYRQYEQKVSGGDPNYEWTEDDFEFFKERAQTLFQLYGEGRDEGAPDSTLLEQAVQDYEKAIELKPDDPVMPALYDQLGLSYYYLGKYQEAMLWFEKKIETNPDDYNTYLKLARCLLALDRNEEAIEKMKKVTELNPEYCAAYKSIAFSYLTNIKDRRAAAEWLQRWAGCDSASYEPDKWLGYLAVTDKPARKDAAIAHLRTAVNKMQAAGIDLCQEKDIVTWLAQVHNMYDDLDMEEEALRWAKRGLKCDPNNKDLKQIVEELE